MGLTLDPLLTRYVRERHARGEFNDKTMRSVESTLRQFSLSYGRRPLERISGRDVERWLTEQVKAGHKPSSRASRLSQVRCFIEWLRVRKMIRHDPMIDVKAPRRPRQVVHIIEKVDVDRVLAACPDSRARAIVMLMYVLGVRCIEIERLNVEDWNRTARVIRLVGKGLHEREVPVVPVVADALEAYLSDFPASSGPLFRSFVRQGRRLGAKYVSEQVSEWQTAAGVKMRPYDGVSAHAFRRTAATELLRATNDLTSTQELLGHANPATLAPYLQRANVERVRAALTDRLAEESPAT